MFLSWDSMGEKAQCATPDPFTNTIVTTTTRGVDACVRQHPCMLAPGDAEMWVWRGGEGADG